MLESATIKAMPVPARAREQMSVHAAAEIEAIGRMLRAQRHADYFEPLLNGALIRIEDLTGVLLSLSGHDDKRPWREMHEVVFGEPMEAPDE